jgi:hypothetical protein
MSDEFKIKYTGTGFPELKTKLTSWSFWKWVLKAYILEGISKLIGF